MTSTNNVQKGVLGALTKDGVDFIKENREDIIGLVLRIDQNGWAQFDLPPLETSESDLVTKTRDLTVSLNIRDADIQFGTSFQTHSELILF